jgi:hypothetical protein
MYLFRKLFVSLWSKIGNTEQGLLTKENEMTNKEPGYVYILTNPSFREDTFDPTDIVVKVASDDSIEYEGRIFKLSPFVGTFMPEEQRNASGAYQGAKYFSYTGKVLDEIRKEKENME